jgi:hypothetical protein
MGNMGSPFMAFCKLCLSVDHYNWILKRPNRSYWKSPFPNFKKICLTVEVLILHHRQKDRPDFHIRHFFLLRKVCLKLSPYLTGNKLDLQNAQPVNAVQGNNRCLLWESYTVWEEWKVFNVKASGTYSYHCILKVYHNQKTSQSPITYKT